VISRLPLEHQGISHLFFEHFLYYGHLPLSSFCAPVHSPSRRVRHLMCSESASQIGCDPSLSGQAIAVLGHFVLWADWSIRAHHMVEWPCLLCSLQKAIPFSFLLAPFEFVCVGAFLL